MKPAKQEYYEIQDGRLVQVTYVPKTERMYINLAKYARNEGFELSGEIIERVNIAINRLMQLEAQYAQR